jgi:hypothetical protein
MNVDSLISTHCDRCGEVELLAEQMWLVLADPQERSHVAFHCPDCGELARRLVGNDALAVLVQLLPVEEVSVPAEALETHDGPTLTADDLIDLMVGLDAVASADCTR